MPRIRTIKPEFPQSESMGRVSREARLLFLLLFTIADDEGRSRGSSRMLASLLFPYDDDAAGLIDSWLEQLEREDCVRRYEVSGAIYLEITNWLKHQKIDKPSKSRLPSFEEGSRVVAKPREEAATDLVSSIRTMDQGSGTLDLLPAASQPEPKQPTASRQRRTANVSLPTDWAPSDEEWKYATSIGFTAVAIDRQALEFREHAKRVDRRCADWSAAWRAWLRKALDIDSTNADRGLDHRGKVSRLPSRIETTVQGLMSDLTEEDFPSRPQSDR